MQAALQRHVDSSISKTINCPEDIPFEAFERIYLDAYQMGLKGCTTYRPNAITGAVLTPLPDAFPAQQPRAHEGAPVSSGPTQAKSGVADADAADAGAAGTGVAKAGAAAAGSPPGEIVYMTLPLERDQILPGFTYKLRWPDSDHAIYVTINDIEREGRRRQQVHAAADHAVDRPRRALAPTQVRPSARPSTRRGDHGPGRRGRWAPAPGRSVRRRNLHAIGAWALPGAR